MCEFGDSSQITEEKVVLANENLIGYRGWYMSNSFNAEEKHLRSLYVDFLWKKDEESTGTPLRDNSMGIYLYNSYYNYSYYNYSDNYYNYNYSSIYYVAGQASVAGKTFIYRDGYRTSLSKPLELVILSNKKWFENTKTVKFAEHFNNTVVKVAEEYGCKTIGYNEFTNGEYD